MATLTKQQLEFNDIIDNTINKVYARITLDNPEMMEFYMKYVADLITKKYTI